MSDTMNEIIDLEIPENLHGIRLDKALAILVPELSRTRIKALILGDNVQLNDVIVTDPSQKVSQSQSITIEVPPILDANPVAQDIPLDILYEDNDVIVINKPAGMVVHPAPGNSSNTLVNALLGHCKDSLSGIGGVKRPGIVHRLDKDTSGLMVVAKNDHAHKMLSSQFADRSLSRVYYAIVWGLPSPTSGTIEGNIGRSPNNRQKMAMVAYGGRTAVTHYRVVQPFGVEASLVECTLETGRTHQIRVHMTSINHAIIGDTTYGTHRARYKDIKSVIHRQALHAKRIKFIHPTTNKLMEFESDLPEDMLQLIDYLEKYIKLTKN